MGEMIVEETKPVVGSLELPTGIKTETGEILKEIVFRELAGPEEDILVSQIPVSQKISLILSNCVKTFGGIDDAFKAKKYIDQIVETDRWMYLVRLRCLSLGPDYHFETTCPSCKAVDKKTADLSLLGVKAPPNVEQMYQETTLPSGAKVRWKIIDGTISAKIEKLATSSNAATVGLYARVTEFNDKPVALVDIKNLSLRDRNAFRKAIDEVEGELEDEIDCECPHCGHPYKVEMRLEPQSFFFP